METGRTTDTKTSVKPSILGMVGGDLAPYERDRGLSHAVQNLIMDEYPQQGARDSGPLGQVRQARTGLVEPGRQRVVLKFSTIGQSAQYCSVFMYRPQYLHQQCSTLQSWSG